MDRAVAFNERSFRIALASAGFRSVARLARRAGLSESYGLQISHGLVPSLEVRQRIARLLGVDWSLIWPALRTTELPESVK